MDIINPATGETLESLAPDENSSISDKVQRARNALAGWRRTPLVERAAIVQRFRVGLERGLDGLARTLSLETGKPIQQSRGELKGLLGRIDFFVEHAAGVLRDETVHDAPGMREVLSREPLGVIGCVSAWNYPYFVGGNVYVPALLTGNTVLYKPSELATLSGLAMAQLWREAGLPDGCFQTVVGPGEVGKLLFDQRLDGAFFTGSYETGRRIAAQLAPRLVPLQLELGGKDPAYVTEDAPVEASAAAVAEGAFYNAGQSCCAVERVYVRKEIFEPFVEHFVREAQALVLGDPLDEKTTLGPLARRDAQIAVLEAQLNDARQRGARILTGGRRAERRGYFFEPTVAVNVNHAMALMREESFGPIIGIQAVESDAEALALMADTPYGLTAAVYTPNAERARTLLSELPVGSAYHNCCDRVSPRLPWSGRGHSGLGCTLSVDGIRAMTVPKAWHLRS
jgi:acyl-CoA reductase-like NAD-dependent aldehyde dehydrogenase